MNTKKFQTRKSGFTLVELLVAMTITIVLLGILIFLTGISIDTYRDSRNEVRASRQAKEAIETISRDLESMVLRKDGNNNEWLYAGEETSNLKGPSGKEIPNTSHLIFFTGATDRYNGDIGGTTDQGGDVSAVSYRLVYRDQIADDDNGEFPVFSLYRHLINPDEAFEELLAVEDLEGAYDTNFESDSFDPDNFLVENIYEFSVTFLVEVVVNTTGTPVTHTVRATMSPGNAIDEFTVTGSGIEYEGDIDFPSSSNLTKEQVEGGSIVGVDISITVLSDQGLILAQRSGIEPAELIRKHGFHYTKSITTPRP